MASIEPARQIKPMSSQSLQFFFLSRRFSFFSLPPSLSFYLHAGPVRCPLAKYYPGVFGYY